MDSGVGDGQGLQARSIKIGRRNNYFADVLIGLKYFISVDLVWLFT